MHLCYSFRAMVWVLCRRESRAVCAAAAYSWDLLKRPDGWRLWLLPRVQE
jgi:hypothetical protein